LKTAGTTKGVRILVAVISADPIPVDVIISTILLHKILGIFFPFKKVKITPRITHNASSYSIVTVEFLILVKIKNSSRIFFKKIVVEHRQSKNQL